jgi:cell division protein FtsQ
MSGTRPSAVAGRLRRILDRSLLAAVVVGAAVGGVVAWDRLDVPVSVVEVSGELTAAERARAIELVAAFLPAGVFELDTEALRARLVDESWIDAASVRRRWPETVEIRISPEVAVARWQGDALLSSRGAVIEPLELVGADSLPRLSGPPGSAPEVMRVFQVVTDVLRPRGLEVESLERDAVGDVSVRTRGGLTIALGADRHAARLQRLATVLAGRLDGRLEDVASLDARYDNGVAVAWRDLPLEAQTTALLTNGTIVETEDPWPTQPQR